MLLCRVDDLAERGARGFPSAHGGRPSIFAVKLDGEVFVYEDACPHFGDTPLPWAKDQYLNHAGDRIRCSAHGAEFDIRTGACLLGACMGCQLTKVDAIVTTDGEVLVAPAAHE